MYTTRLKVIFSVFQLTTFIGFMPNVLTIGSKIPYKDLTCSRWEYVGAMFDISCQY